MFAKVEGQAVLDECSGIHDDAKVTDLVEGIEESLAEHADAVALALSKQQAQMKLTPLEAEELACHQPHSSPWHALDKDARTTVIRSKELLVRDATGSF